MIKLITHTDLDGVGCSVLAKLTFEHIDISFADYNNINEEIEKAIKEHEKYDRIFITDISFNNTTLIKKIEENTDLQNKVTLLDHHQTASFLAEYPWAIIRSLPESGTSLFYKYLIENKYLTASKILNDFVELVRQYDTWE